MLQESRHPGFENQATLGLRPMTSIRNFGLEQSVMNIQGTAVANRNLHRKTPETRACIRDLNISDRTWNCILRLLNTDSAYDRIANTDI